MLEINQFLEKYDATTSWVDTFKAWGAPLVSHGGTDTVRDATDVGVLNVWTIDTSVRGYMNSCASYGRGQNSILLALLLREVISRHDRRQ